MKILAVDLGGSYMKYGVVDEDANILERGQVPSPSVGVDCFADAVTDVYRKYADQVEGLAISLPGAIDSDTGYARTAGAFMDLYGKNIFEVLQEKIPVPMAIENDGKCGALAEVWKGSLTECQDGVVVILGTGIAGGIVKNRRLHKGKNFTAGELSCLMVKPNDFSMQNIMCIPGAMMGLTMAVAAAKGIDPSTLETAALQENFSKKTDHDMAEFVGQSAAASPQPGDALAKGQPDLEADRTESQRPGESQVKVDGPQIFRWLEEGDPVVTGIYQNFIAHLGMMTYNLQVVFDPEKIVFGGGVSRQPRLVPDIRSEVNKIYKALGSIIPVVPPVIENCQFLNDANLVGAVYNYLIHQKPELAK